MTLRSILLFFLIINLTLVHAQTPGVKWSKSLSSESFNNWFFFDGVADGQGNYYFASADTTWQINSNEIINKVVRGRAAIMKTDKNGNRVWFSQFFNNVHPGGAGYTSISNIKNESFVVAGYQHPTCCQTIQRNFLVSKYSTSGATSWHRMYTGSGDDIAMSVTGCSFGGYLISGHSNSNDGDFNQNKGNTDVWLFRLDEAGNLIWKKNYGGTDNDTAYSITETADKGFIVAGATTSINGDLAGVSHNGASDAWLFKVDSSGNLQWSKVYGGANQDGFKKIIRAPGNTFVCTGYSKSSTVSANGNKGGADLWAVRLNAQGGVVWSRTYGGSNDEAGYGISITPSNGCLIAGYTLSNDQDVKISYGKADSWLVMLSLNGTLDWEKTIGSTEDDFGFWPLNLSENIFLTAGVAGIVGGGYQSSNRGSLTLLGNSNSIRGFSFLDVNKNGIKETGEPPADNLTIKVTKDPSFERSAMPYNGFFNVDVDTGTFRIAASLPVSNPYYTVQPAFKTYTYNNFFNIDTALFALTPVGKIRDWRISLVAENILRPGFAMNYKLIYENVGTDTVVNGIIKLVKSNKIIFNGAIPAQSSINGDTILWQVPQLKPFEKKTIAIDARAVAPPDMNNGDTIRTIATLYPVTNDQTPADDTAVVVQEARGSYDPNDKTDNFNGKMLLSEMQKGQPITYLIRFQNTGTDTAFTVTIRDTLQAMLMPETFQMLDASHPYILQIKNKSQLTWTFNDILLPDSNVNERLSHGYILFNIRPNSTLQLNDVIKNSASIYFDYNLPVVTNEQQTVLISNTTTGVSDFVRVSEKMQLFPNPSGGAVFLKIQEPISGNMQVEVFSAEGKRLHHENLGFYTGSGFTYQLLLNNLLKGTYFIKLTAGKKTFLKTLVVL